MNRVMVNGRLVERTALRYTPAGIPVIDATLDHASEVMEAGLRRKLAFSFEVTAIGDMARQLSDENLGSELALGGFLAPRSRRSTRIRVHVLELTRLAPAALADAGADGND
jgi:primosomal replication protein N